MVDKIKRVILDIDVGTDDALALFLFLHADKLKQIKLEAIICTMGNTTVENVCKNVVRLLEVTGRTDIPVYKGATKQFIKPNQKIKLFHGNDGFGDLKHDTEPNLSIIKNKPAAVALHEIVTKYSKDITLVCLAPLTNIALAIRLYNDFVTHLKEIFIMGGNYNAVGNVTSCAEYNFYVDPEAAHIVLNSVICPVTILTWETCLKSNIAMEWKNNIFGKTKHAGMKLLMEAEQNVYPSTKTIWSPCDAFLAAVFLYPVEMVLKHSTHHATVELHGAETRGQIVLDHLKQKQSNVTIIRKTNDEFFKKLVLEVAEL